MGTSTVFYWIGWKVSSLFWNAPNPCQDVVTNIQSGKQPVILKVTIKDATLYDFKIPGVQSDALLNLVDDGKGPEQYKIIKKLKVTILESPNEHKDASFYKDKIGSYIKEANTYYSAKTGNIKNPQITAEVGNPRILFKDVDLIIKKGTRENYNYQIPAEEDAYNAEAKVNENNDETMQLIYVHSLSRYYPANTKNVRVIRGMSNNGHHVIENSDYTVFSYNRMFNDDMAVYGTPGSTVAHEFGHYFNLDHPFEGGCAEMNGGDHVSDTPPAEGALWYLIDDSPNAHGINNPCQNAPSCPGTRRQVENIMDYGPCRWMFTKGQADRMTTRINTKPSLFNVISAHDASVDPNTINIVVDDQRKGELRRKRDEPASDISIRMIYPNSKDGIYNLEVVSDRAEKAKIQIFNNNQIMVYEKDILVEKGSNSFQMEPSIFDRSGLYILFYTAKGRAKQIKILPR
ncbi:hypothetical protein BOQ62_06785 [Chryseobacterium sp. CH21]|uniref:M43 family zinc metalloprotease n=1 Tax=Chryseobacterium sp. CH21 TaxID=713556 RepID=UPI00100B3369|nr:M43 family zinc metalloprotease [Chryseobacterium sp. CH21]RXM40401.1 hypothetical protein BOQ62_06785 [Chryseobacterium sp. CH21]